MKLDTIGSYVSFDHEPTEDELLEAVGKMVDEFKPLFAERSIRKSPNQEMGKNDWTVGIKFFLHGR